MAQGRDPKSIGYLYVIESSDQDAYKVGFATNVYQRLQSLQAGNPGELSVWGHVRATYAAEQAFHQLMTQFRIRLEWYRPVNEVEIVLDELMDDAMDRAMVWLADNHPDSTNPDMISLGYENILIEEDDVRRTVRLALEPDNGDVLHMSGNHMRGFPA